MIKFVIKKQFYCTIIAILVWGMSLCCYGVSLDRKNKSPSTDKVKPKLDIIFVIDNSGSMKENDPNFITREVVTSFSSALESQSRLGMVLFDHTARLVEPLTEKRDDKPDAKFVKSLEKVNYKGQFTNSPAGIERAIYELKTNGRHDAEKAIIFLTDGIVDTGDKLKDIERGRWLKEDLAEESQKSGIRIFGIAFTEKANVNLIQTLALKTNGEYFRAIKASDIPGIFKKITALINKPTPKTSVKMPVKTSASSRMNFLLSFILIVSLILLGAIVWYIFYFRTTKSPLKPVSDHRVPESPFTSDLPIPEATLIDIKKFSLNGVMPLVLNKSKITIGRDSSNDIVIPDGKISSFHATIEFKEGFFYLEDYRSTNGTSLNNKKIVHHDPVKLKSGDKIHFSSFEFKFMISDHDPIGKTVMIGSPSIQQQEGLTGIISSKKAYEKDQPFDQDESFTRIISSKKKDLEPKHIHRDEKTDQKDQSFDQDEDLTRIISSKKEDLKPKPIPRDEKTYEKDQPSEDHDKTIIRK